MSEKDKSTTAAIARTTKFLAGIIAALIVLLIFGDLSGFFSRRIIAIFLLIVIAILIYEQRDIIMLTLSTLINKKVGTL